MTKREEAKLNMYRTVQQLCIQNSSTTITNPAFTTSHNNFTQKIESLLQAITTASTITTGIAQDKLTAKKNLSQQATDIAGIIYAYATTIQNNTLAQQVNFSYTKLFETKDELTTPTIQYIHQLATRHLAALTPYGITPAILTSFQTTINNYSTAIPTPRTAKTQQLAQIAITKQLVKEIDSILKNQLDKLIIIFKPLNPNFVETYKIARTIIDPSATTTQLKIKIENEHGTPIPNATIQITGSTTTTAITSTKGTATIKPLTPGTHSITASAENHTTTSIQTIEIKQGKINRQTIKLSTKQ